MNESKIVVTERLRREGRWAEASKFKDAAAANFRDSGMTRAQANEAAWNATAEKFPPLSIEPAESEDGLRDAASAVSQPIPWRDLPTEANFDDEVRWVHQQYIVILEESPRGRIIHSAAPVSALATDFAPGQDVGGDTFGHSDRWKNPPPGCVRRARGYRADFFAPGRQQGPGWRFVPGA